LSKAADLGIWGGRTEPKNVPKAASSTLYRRQETDEISPIACSSFLRAEEKTRAQQIEQMVLNESAFMFLGVRKRLGGRLGSAKIFADNRQTSMMGASIPLETSV
jgi:hypothetical protein